MKATVGSFIVITGLLIAASDASAQDTRWTPWVGCWELVNENVRGGVGASRASALSPDPKAGAVTEAAPRVCVERAGNNGATLTTTVPDQAPVEQTLIPDGNARPIDDAECRGTESTEWSRNGQRIFARAEVTCADGTPRAISGLGLITADDMWLDVRSFRVGSSVTTRVSRYRRLGDAGGTLPALTGSPFTLSEVKEANSKVSAPVLEAVLAETKPRLDVRKRTLLELADADVAPSVIDVMIALAYPERFVIERADRRSYASSTERRPTDPYPFGIDDYYYSGYFYPSYYYSPFGYGYIGRYDPFLFGPAFLPSGPGGGRWEQPIQPSGSGRVINGQGYTRVRPTDASEQAATVSSDQSSGGSSSRRSAASGGSGTASPRGYSGSGDSSPSSGSSSSGSSSSDSSSGASSGGGSNSGGSSGGDGGGRTAVPR